MSHNDIKPCFLIWGEKKLSENFSGRILLRISPELHQQVIECAQVSSKSLNAFISETLEERVEKMMNTLMPKYTRVVVGDLAVKDVREAVVVTQHPWYMQLFNEHKVYLFNPKLGQVKPMRYLLCYETTLTEADGSINAFPRHVKQWGRVKEILYNLTPADYHSIPDLVPLTKDNRFWNKFKPDDINHVVLLEEVGSFSESIPLRDWQKSKYSLNKESSLVKVRNAKFVEDLYS